MKTLQAILAPWVAAILIAAPVWAQEADPERGETLYLERCAGCHGEEGDGAGPGAERLNPPPRDFTEGMYKFRTTGFDDIVPNDADLFRMIADGMPGTAMPGWSDVLSARDIRDLIAYIKIFAGLEEEQPSEQIDYGEQIPVSAESIAAGRLLFEDRCQECHGAEGKGDAIKKLKDDGGERTWPRNFTKPWTFRVGNRPKDIFERASVGIPGTQMPSFADPISKKILSIEERWHVANYINSLAGTAKLVRADNTVIKADKVEGDLPGDALSPAWATAEPSTFFLVPQIIAKDRLFTPSNDTITVRALYDDEDVAFLLEWDDRTQSIPGDEKAEKIADPDMAEDAVAIQLPVKIPERMEKPYFGMGDPNHPVNLFHWTSGGLDRLQVVSLMNGRGFEKITPREAGDVNLRGSGVYKDGTWRVIITRSLTTVAPDLDIQFSEGVFIPIAFAAWDGSNSEKASRHTMTTWYWLLLKPPVGVRPFLLALLVAALVAAGLLWWGRMAELQSLTKSKAGENGD